MKCERAAGLTSWMRRSISHAMEIRWCADWHWSGAAW
jgi:hypothetical protein